MRKLLVGLMVTLVLSFPAARMGAGQNRYDFKLERKTLKARQKQEWKAVKLQQKYQKRSWKGMRMSRATRAQMKHQMQREKRALRETQRNDRQELKDRQRLMKERMRQVY
jgi:hypothetical protein